MYVPCGILSIGSVIASLQQVPIAFHPVRAVLAIVAAYILTLFVIYDAMLVSGRQSVITFPRVGTDGRTSLNVLDDLTLKRIGGRIGYDHRPNVAAPLTKSEYDGLRETPLPHFLPLIRVHGSRFLTDEGFVSLNSAAQRLRLVDRHRTTDTMLHKPSRLLGDT